MPAKEGEATLVFLMRAALALTAALLAAHAHASPATAAATSHTSHTTSIQLVRRSAGTFVQPTGAGHFTLAGVRWRGPGRVEFRTRSVEGTWSGWRNAAAEPGDAPDHMSPEARRRTWRLGSPWWVGPSDRIEARSRGRVGAIRAELVWSPEEGVPDRTLAAAGAPAIVSRSGWGADEAIRKGAPSYAPQIRFVVVHHTAGTNNYDRAEAPAIVRGIELYHVRSNGWNDIGYNFLVDRFGTIYEGRYGGIDRNVVGAHALGFNTGSVGIAVLGSYGQTAPSRAAQDALARLIAWRLDLAHVDPTSSVTVVSGGSERYPKGTPVRLRVVSGHRDTGSTECPGDQLYARLDVIAAQARSIGGPKIFEPTADVSGTSVRIRARLSSSLAWLVSVTTAAGVEVARGTGTGAAVDWTWDSSAAPPGSYTWTISAGAALPAAGTVRAGGSGSPPPLGITDASVAPDTISPNGDRQADTATLTYTLSENANVTVQVTDASGAVVATLADGVPTAAGTHTMVITGDALADGRYEVVLTATSPSGESTQVTLSLVVSRTLGAVAVSPSAFSPNGDGRNDMLTVTFTLTAPATVRVRIVRDGRWVATPFSGELSPGPQSIAWNGTRSAGVARDGSYSAVVDVQDAVGASSLGVPFTLDTRPPRVRVLNGRGLRIEVDEPATLVVRVDGVLVRRQVRRAGVVRIPRAATFARVAVVATDAAGNQSAPVVVMRRRSGQARQ